ncbi:M48 family metalloprotease [Herbidospora sp. NBRC 101105]|uniref:M48 family metalloprotease n=1 Tax=Herbidospora sp. NBRC 101105 TaxID=3032195 RepID=UPI00249FEF00|nr:M48 family metalloprotease [Herbidospora sp. NBRC 101105]GLX93411.1 hypothetical protein Hesp01_13610 [Herbidospora sp. NBRC 101105]
MTGPETRDAPRLNPFLLPSSTTSRFLVLILATVAGALFVDLYLRTLWWTVANTPEQVRAGHCLAALRSGRLEEAAAVADRYAACAVRVTMIDSLIPVAMLAAPLVGTVVLYLLHPVFAVRHRPMALAEAGAGPHHDAVMARFAQILAEETPRRTVRLLVDPARSDLSGRTFGLPGRHTVVLSMGTVLAYKEEPRVAEALLRHELAHIRNRDVGIAHVTVAVWWAFLLTGALPIMVATAVWNPAGLAAMALFLAVILLLLWSSRTAVLRSREHHADVRAGDTPARMEGVKAAVERARPLSRHRRLGNHPGPGRRTTVLTDPGRLSRPGAGELLTVGLLSGMCFGPVFDSFAYVNFESGPDAKAFLPGVLFGALLSGTALVAVWRAVPAGLAGGGRLWVSAAAMTAGLLLGQWFVQSQSRNFWTGLERDPLAAALMAAGLLVLVRLFLSWAKACATAWLPMANRLRVVTLTAVAVGALVIGPWLGLWHHGLQLLGEVADSRQVPAILAVFAARHPVHLFTIVLAGGFLVAAGARRGRPARPLALHLDGAPPAPLARAHSRFLAALAAAFASVLVMLAAGFALQPWLFEAARTGRQLTSVYVLIGVAVALFGVAALVVGSVTGGRRRIMWAAAHTAPALAVAGVPMALVLLGHVALAECGLARALSCYTQGASFPATLGNYYVLTFAYALFPGLLLAVVAALVRAVRPPATAVPARRPLPVRIAAIAVVAVVAATGIVGAVTQWAWYLRVLPEPPARWSPEVIEALQQPIRERTLPRPGACRDVLAAYRGAGAADVLAMDRGHWLTVARTVNRIASADDDGLRIFAQAGYTWFGRADAEMVGRTTSRLAHYCTLVQHEDGAL